MLLKISKVLSCLFIKYLLHKIDKYNKILSNVNDESIVKEVEILNSMIK